jgi:hypothetical protein
VVTDDDEVDPLPLEVAGEHDGLSLREPAHDRLHAPLAVHAHDHLAVAGLVLLPPRAALDGEPHLDGGEARLGPVGTIDDGASDDDLIDHGSRSERGALRSPEPAGAADGPENNRTVRQPRARSSASSLPGDEPRLAARTGLPCGLRTIGARRFCFAQGRLRRSAPRARALDEHALVVRGL